MSRFKNATGETLIIMVIGQIYFPNNYPLLTLKNIKKSLNLHRFATNQVATSSVGRSLLGTSCSWWLQLVSIGSNARRDKKRGVAWTMYVGIRGWKTWVMSGHIRNASKKVHFVIPIYQLRKACCTCDEFHLI